jgi:hypothetical protein
VNGLRTKHCGGLLESKSSFLGLTFALLSLACVSSCGGGGSGGSNSGSGGVNASNLSSAPGGSIFGDYLQKPGQTALVATDDSGNSYTLDVEISPYSGITTFNNVFNVYETEIFLTLQKNGVIALQAMTNDFYLLNPYQPVGSAGVTLTPYQVVVSSNPLPSTLNIGDSGPLYSATTYHDPNKTALDGTEIATYTVMENDATTIRLCFDSTISGVTTQGTADGLADGTESDCYSVDSSGNMQLIGVAITAGAVTLDFH